MSKRKPSFIKLYSDFLLDEIKLEKNNIVAYIDDERYICKIDCQYKVHYFKIRKRRK